MANKDRGNMTPKQRESIIRRLEKRAKDLNKRYPDNSYEIKDNFVVRVKGRRPHKISKKASQDIKKG